MKSNARFLNVLLGVWLFISAFAWSHTPAQFTNSWVCGVLCVVFSLIAIGYAPARYLNTALAVWLFASAWVLPTIAAATVWHNVVVSLCVFLLSLVPSYDEPVRPSAFRPESRDTGYGDELHP